MVQCSFSGKEIPQGTGIMYVRKDGRVYYFLNRKCMTAMLERKQRSRTIKWTETYRELKKNE